MKTYYSGVFWHCTISHTIMKFRIEPCHFRCGHMRFVANDKTRQNFLPAFCFRVYFTDEPLITVKRGGSFFRHDPFSIVFKDIPCAVFFPGRNKHHTRSSRRIFFTLA